MAKFKYFVAVVTDINLIHEEIKEQIKLEQCLLRFTTEPFLFSYGV